jgi:hypothetical protein
MQSILPISVICILFLLVHQIVGCEDDGYAMYVWTRGKHEGDAMLVLDKVTKTKYFMDERKKLEVTYFTVFDSS